MYKNYRSMTVEELHRLLALAKARIAFANAIGDGDMAQHWATIADEIEWFLTYGELR